jgi:hypothetical protein
MKPTKRYVTNLKEGYLVVHHQDYLKNEIKPT